MKRILIAAAALALAATGAAYAQDSTVQPRTNELRTPARTPGPLQPLMTAPGGGQEESAPADISLGPMPDKSAGTKQTPSGNPDLILTEDEAKGLLGRAVYSREGKWLGEVTSLQRGADNKLTDIYAEVGGFLGIGETRVRIAADQVEDLMPDRVVLTLGDAEVNKLPAVGRSAVKDKY
jgi:PRC-barrel domain